MTRNIVGTAALVAAFASLAACGPKNETKAPAAATIALDTGATTVSTDTAVPVSQVGKMVKGKGVVVAVDAAAGTVTLDHEAIEAAGWPAMTMPFKAPASLIAKAKPGEKVTFDLRIEDMGGEITSMKPE